VDRAGILMPSAPFQCGLFIGLRLAVHPRGEYVLVHVLAYIRVASNEVPRFVTQLPRVRNPLLRDGTYRPDTAHRLFYVARHTALMQSFALSRRAFVRCIPVAPSGKSR
jgi:hypothetical protein